MVHLIYTTAVLLLLSATAIGQPAYNLRFQQLKSDGTHYDVKLQICGTSEFGNGGANLVFDYNASCLTNPVLLHAHEFSGGNYAPITIGRPLPDAVSINIEYLGESGQAKRIPTFPHWVDIATIRFDIKNPEELANFAFRGSEISISPTVIFLDDLQTILPAGNLYDISVSLHQADLLSFAGRFVDESVQLSWQTRINSPAIEFVVERSEPTLTNWMEAGSVEANTSLSPPGVYTFTDFHPLEGAEMIYRLRQINDDGRISFSNILRFSRQQPDSPQLYQNYPNPFRISTTIPIYLPIDGFAEVKILDPSGREIETLIAKALTAGYHSVVFTSEELPSGTYQYVVRIGRSVLTRQLTIIR